MKVEIIDFYPRKIELPNLVVGSMHLFLEEIGVDLRGVMVRFVNKKTTIRIPYGKGKDSLTGEECAFSVFSFANRLKNIEMIQSIKKKLKSSSSTR